MPPMEFYKVLYPATLGAYLALVQLL